MRPPPSLRLVAFLVSCVGAGSIRPIRIDLDARSRPWTEGNTQGSCLLEGPEFRPYEVKFAHVPGATLGDAWAWLGHQNDDHFPLRYDVTFQGIADACDPHGPKPRMRVRLRSSRRDAAWLDPEPDERRVYDSFDIVLEPGSLRTRPVVLPPGGDGYVVPPATIVRVGGVDLADWMARVDLRLGNSRAQVYSSDARVFRRRIDSVLWEGDSLRTIEIEYCGRADDSRCDRLPAFERRIRIDQANRRFVLPEVAP